MSSSYEDEEQPVKALVNSNGARSCDSFQGRGLGIYDSRVPEPCM